MRPALPLGAVAVAGMGLSWLRDNMCMVDSPEQAGELAASVPDTGGVYFVPAFSGLLAPHWEDSARGTILGLTGGGAEELSAPYNTFPGAVDHRIRWLL